MLLHRALFWLHLAIIIGAISIGFFLSLPAVLAIVAAHRLHVIAFGGCLISRLQLRLGMLPRRANFLQVAAQKFFRQNLSLPQAKIIDYSLASLPVSIATARLFI